MSGGGRVPRGTVTIDIHCHVSAPAVEALVRPVFTPEKDPFTYYAGPASLAYNRAHFAEIQPKLTLAAERLRDMDRMEIDIQAISVAPSEYHYWTDGDLGARVARIQNDNLAQIVADHPDRFVALGTVPLQDVDASLRELDRLAIELRFPGIEICSNVNGVDFDDPRFVPFFERVQALDLLLVVHPNGFTHGQRLAPYYMTNTVGMPLDTSIFLARTIFGGVYERFPELRVCVVHGGGYLPSYPARYDHAWRTRADCRQHIPRPPSTYLRRLHYDSMLFDSFELSVLVQRYGADHVLLGSDYPYDMGDPDPVDLICSVPELGEEEQRLLLGGNAARLLKLSI